MLSAMQHIRMSVKETIQKLIWLLAVTSSIKSSKNLPVAAIHAQATKLHHHVWQMKWWLRIMSCFLFTVCDYDPEPTLSNTICMWTSICLPDTASINNRLAACSLWAEHQAASWTHPKHFIAVLLETQAFYRIDKQTSGSCDATQPHLVDAGNSCPC